MTRRVAVVALLVAALVGVWVSPASAHVALPFTSDMESGIGMLVTQNNAVGGCPTITAAISTTRAHSGGSSLAINSSTSADCAMGWGGGADGNTTPILVQGHTYVFSAWVWYPSSGSSPFNGRTVARDGSNGVGFVNLANYSAVTKDAWVQVESVFTPTAGVSDFSVRFYATGSTVYVDDVVLTDQTGSSGPAGATCGGPGQPACNTNISGDSGGFLSGIGGAVGSVLSSPLTAIKNAVDSLGSFIVNGFSSLLLPSSGTTSGIASMWSTAQTKFPFSVATELVTLPSTVLSSIQSGIASGPPSDCSSYLCGSGGAISAVSVYAPVSTLRNVVGFILVAMFAYGVLRSIGQAIK